MCACHQHVFQHNSLVWGWFGVGLAWFGLARVGGTVMLPDDSTWLGLGLVWLGLAWCGFSDTVVLSADSTGLGLVWLRLAWCGFCGTAVPSLASAWFGFGLAWFGSLRFGLSGVWFGDVFCSDAPFPGRSATVRRNPLQSVAKN